jgi:hypothetical protein
MLKNTTIINTRAVKYYHLQIYGMLRLHSFHLTHYLHIYVSYRDTFSDITHKTVPSHSLAWFEYSDTEYRLETSGQ